MRNTLKFLLITLYCPAILSDCIYSMEKKFTEQLNININQNEIMQLFYKYSNGLGNIISKQDYLNNKSNYDSYNTFKSKADNYRIRDLLTSLKEETYEYFNSNGWNNNGKTLFQLAWNVIYTYIFRDYFNPTIWNDAIKDPNLKFINDKIGMLTFISDNTNTENTVDDNISVQNIDLTKEKRLGLQNIGATCYMNATLQCFANLPKFLEEFIISHSNVNKSKPLSDEFYKVIIHLCEKNPINIDYAPHDFKNKISTMNQLFAGIQANDSKDLALFLIQTLHEELNNQNKTELEDDNQYDYHDVKQKFDAWYNNNYKSVFSNEFYYKVCSILTCKICTTSTYNIQSGNILIFPLNEVSKFKKKANNTVTLDDCFEYDARINDMPNCYCQKCQKQTTCMSKNEFIELPNTLVINLNYGKGKQFDIDLELQEEINLSKYVTENKNNAEYFLSGIVCHLGQSGMDGHFIAYTRSQTGIWYKYNDSLVTKMNNWNEVLQAIKKYNGIPYLLFYSKKHRTKANDMQLNKISNTQNNNNHNIINNMQNINSINNFNNINGQTGNNFQNNMMMNNMNLNNNRNNTFNMWNNMNYNNNIRINNNSNMMNNFMNNQNNMNMNYNNMMMFMSMMNNMRNKNNINNNMKMNFNMNNNGNSSNISNMQSMNNMNFNNNRNNNFTMWNNMNYNFTQNKVNNPFGMNNQNNFNNNFNRNMHSNYNSFTSNFAGNINNNFNSNMYNNMSNMNSNNNNNIQNK